MLLVLLFISTKILMYDSGTYITKDPNRWICMPRFRSSNNGTNKLNQDIRLQINEIMIQTLKFKNMYITPPNTS